MNPYWTGGGTLMAANGVLICRTSPGGTLLAASAALSLPAQLAVAKPDPSGWLLSAVPALAFMALAKLVPAPINPLVATAPAPSTTNGVVAEPVTTTPPTTL